MMAEGRQDHPQRSARIRIVLDDQNSQVAFRRLVLKSGPIVFEQNRRASCKIHSARMRGAVLSTVWRGLLPAGARPFAFRRQARSTDAAPVEARSGGFRLIC